MRYQLDLMVYVAEAGKEAASIEVTTLPSEQGKVKKIRGQEVLAFDYGFQATFLSTGMSVPGSAVDLALTNFAREWKVSRLAIKPFLTLQCGRGLLWEVCLD